MPGQVIGVRMAMLGCSLIGLNNPASPEQIKNLVVYVEIDRCATDAIAYVTGVKLGRRSLKFVDHGIMAANFRQPEDGQGLPHRLPGGLPGTGRQVRAGYPGPASATAHRL